jgi:hypothetical protein
MRPDNHPGLDEHRRSTELANDLSGFQDRFGILNFENVNSLSGVFVQGNEWHFLTA